MSGLSKNLFFWLETALVVSNFPLFIFIFFQAWLINESIKLLQQIFIWYDSFELTFIPPFLVLLSFACKSQLFSDLTKMSRTHSKGQAFCPWFLLYKNFIRRDFLKDLISKLCDRKARTLQTSLFSLVIQIASMRNFKSPKKFRHSQSSWAKIFNVIE